MEKILIRDNQLAADQDVIMMENIVNELNEKLLVNFADLNIGELTNELLLDIIAGNCAKVERMIKDQADRDVKKISSPAIKKTLLSSIEPLIAEFRTIADKLKQRDMSRFMQYVEARDGKICGVENAEELIRENYRYYIDDPKEIEIYSRLRAIADNYNEFMALITDRAKMHVRINTIYDLIDIHQQTHLAEVSDLIDYSNFLRE